MMNFLNLEKQISFKNSAKHTDAIVDVTRPITLMPIVLIMVCAKIRSVNAVMKLSNPTNFLSQIGTAKDAGFTS